MISFEELKKISRTRIRDTKVLLDNKSYDGALYLCGYAVEIALKAIICKNLNAEGKQSSSHIPSTIQEFDTIKSLKTHDIEVLLNLAPTSLQTGIKGNPKKLVDWSILQDWNPEMRYSPIRGRELAPKAQQIVESAQRILRYLWKHI